MKEGYIPQAQRKKILLLCDDIRMTSGISTMAREIVIGTSHRFNWVNVGGAITHPDKGKRFDLNDDTNKNAGIPDASVYLYPVDGYGSPELIRQMIEMEKPDALMMFTDPRYWIWLFQMEQEIRKQIPIIPHGINEQFFFPITQDKPEYLALQDFKKRLYGEKNYDFTLLYNARNIRRKCVPDLMLAWKIFIDQLSKEKQDKCALVLHTQRRDENGTDLVAVKDMLFGNLPQYNVIFDENKYPTNIMNLLYNATDANALISSNEGWGLSLTEAMMAGKPIIATVTGGMQDQMRFEDENGKWIKFTEEFGSNHRGKYKKHGKWAYPVFPSNLSIVGSIPTPYIFDDRAEPFDIAEQIMACHKSGKTYREFIGQEAHKWVISDESMMSASNMCKNVIEGIDETFAKWQPRHRFELIQVETPKQPKHFVKHVIAK